MVEPLTDYLRYEVAAYRLNGKAGEDIRLIPVRGGHWPEGLPTGQDFWLFDDSEVWDMHYDAEGRFVKATRSESDGYLDQCRRWRDVALDQAVTLADYLRAAADAVGRKGTKRVGPSPPSPRCAGRSSSVGPSRRQPHR